MDSHTDTADPWATAVDDVEVNASVVERSSNETEVDEAESVMYEATQGEEAEPAKGGLFGRRKSRTGQAASEEVDGEFPLISPAPFEMSDDLQFETAHSESLEPTPRLGSTDDATHPPGEDALHPRVGAVDKDAGYGSSTSSLNPSSSAPSQSLDLENVSEGIANAVEEAQPAGIFGALSNPGSMLASAEKTSPVAEDHVAEGHNSVPTLETVEDALREMSLDEGPGQDGALITGDRNIEAGVLIDVTAKTHEAVPEEEEPVDATDETTQDGQSADLAPEERPEMELRKIEDVSESTFSLTNAPAEPEEGGEELFVSTGSQDEVQPVVLVTTDTVPGMEMGDSCGLVTAVHGAADATDLVAAIEKTHADLGDRASEVGATAVISVTTAINEVQAGFLVVASGTAVVAAS